MIFFDFDGTIVDLWPRYYQVFLAASESSGVSQSDYVRVKQSLVSDSEVARYFGKTLPEGYFQKKRMLLEAETYLRLDTLLVSAEELNAFFLKFECRLLTSRRRADAFLAQDFSRSSHIVVGDSKAEWETAALENVRAVLVRTGLRRPEDFPLTRRHMTAPSVSAFITAYMERGIQL